MEEQLIFDTQGEAYLSDALSYTLPSCHIACWWPASKRKWRLTSCIKKIVFFGGHDQSHLFFRSGHTSSSCYEHTNRPFPHSCKQGHQLEAQVDKIQRFVWNCPPEPCPHFFMFAHWRVMQKRSITPLLQNFFWLEKKKMIKWQATTRLSLFANWIIQYFASGLLKIVVFLTYAHYGHDMNA